MVEEGQLLRATLVLASGSPLGASDSALLPAAVSIELLHLASLVHDDIIDEATERRGGPALHVAAGRDRALVVGDFLIVAAFDVIGEMRGSASEGAFAASVNALSKGAQLCCFGQLEELDPRDRVPAEAHYLDVVAQKTGSLFAAAATLGALAAGADPEGLATLAALGTQLGVAYQIRDDLRDRAGNERWQRQELPRARGTRAASPGSRPPPPRTPGPFARYSGSSIAYRRPAAASCAGWLKRWSVLRPSPTGTSKTDSAPPAQFGWRAKTQRDGRGRNEYEAAWVGELDAGTVIPLQRPGANANWRVAVEEWELLPGDPPSSVEAPPATFVRPIWERRLIYADEVAL